MAQNMRFKIEGVYDESEELVVGLELILVHDATIIAMNQFILGLFNIRWEKDHPGMDDYITDLEYNKQKEELFSKLADIVSEIIMDEKQKYRLRKHEPMVVAEDGTITLYGYKITTEKEWS